jgi:hypothetical protein
MLTDRHVRLIALLARIDKQIVEAEAVVHNANIPAEDWFRCSDLLRTLERAREDAAAKLRAAG